MKTNTISLVFIISLLLCSCEPKELYPTHPQPNWQVENDVDMRYSMTIVGALPEHLLADADTADIIADFVVANSENSDTLCCGLTHLTPILGSNENNNATYLRAFLYITLPTGVKEDCRIFFRYYATRTRYLYQAESTIPFQSDAIIGNISDPYEIAFGEPR